MVGDEGQPRKQLVPTGRLTMGRPGPSGAPDCAESRVRTVGGTEESPAVETSKRRAVRTGGGLTSCSAVRRSHPLQTRNQSTKEDVGSRK